jgi:hypothetical protein
MKKFIPMRYIVLFLVGSFFPSLAFASNIYFETSRSTVSAGDTFIVSAMIDSENTSVNSVEGDIVLSSQNNNFSVNDFGLAKSIFTLWPRTPSLSKDGNIISFVGGVPGGVNLNKAIIFNIAVETSKEGDVNFSLKNMAVFANDGKGTRLPIKVENLTVKVLPRDESIAVNNDWSNLIVSDKKSPNSFPITIGKESSLFDGKRFAFFTAIDDQSGISYYEVSEDGQPAVRSGSIYVLQNQDAKHTPNLTVTAYDKAGNKTVSVYKAPGFTIFGFSLNFFIILILVIVIWIFFRRMRRNRRNRNK